MHQLRNLILDGRIHKALFLLKNQKLSTLELTQKDPENNTPLHWAVKLGYVELIQSLLKTDAQMTRSIKNQQGLRPYDIAKTHRFSPQLLLRLRCTKLTAANTDHHQDGSTWALYAK